MGLSVPVELQNFPQDLELTGEPVNAVEVRLRASPGIIQRLGPGDVSARIDLKGAMEGERIVHLTGDSIRVPFGVRVVKISPAIITLNFERTQQKVVPIRPRILGRPAAGYEVAEVTASPAEVRVVGPKSRVNDVESAYTEPVSVDGARSDVVERVNIGIEDPLLRIQGTPRVEVTARVREVHDTRVFDGLPIAVRGCGGHAASRAGAGGPVGPGLGARERESGGRAAVSRSGRQASRRSAPGGGRAGARPGGRHRQGMGADAGRAPGCPGGRDALTGP